MKTLAAPPSFNRLRSRFLLRPLGIALAAAALCSAGQAAPLFKQAPTDNAFTAWSSGSKVKITNP